MVAKNRAVAADAPVNRLVGGEIIQTGDMAEQA
jgi:hypothetical protein